MSWLNFGLKDFIDVLLVSIITYKLFNVLRGSASKTLFAGVLTFLLIWLIVSPILEMKLLGTIMDTFITGGFVLLVILFQDEIRRFLIILGSKGRWAEVSKLFVKKEEKGELPRQLAAITLACLNLSKKKCGALIVIEGKDDLSPYVYTGEQIDAAVNARLIENIFFKNSPLHDGAMIIRNNRIVAAGCILPISHSTEVPREMGLRHRSGLGMATETDAKIVIVSEERGRISTAKDGIFTPNISTEDLQNFLLENS